MCWREKIAILNKNPDVFHCFWRLPTEKMEIVHSYRFNIHQFIMFIYIHINTYHIYIYIDFWYQHGHVLDFPMSVNSLVKCFGRFCLASKWVSSKNNQKISTNWINLTFRSGQRGVVAHQITRLMRKTSKFWLLNGLWWFANVGHVVFYFLLLKDLSIISEGQTSCKRSRTRCCRDDGIMVWYYSLNQATCNETIANLQRSD